MRMSIIIFYIARFYRHLHVYIIQILQLDYIYHHSWTCYIYNYTITQLDSSYYCYDSGDSMYHFLTFSGQYQR